MKVVRRKKFTVNLPVKYQPFEKLAPQSPTEIAELVGCFGYEYQPSGIATLQSSYTVIFIRCSVER